MEAATQVSLSSIHRSVHCGRPGDQIPHDYRYVQTILKASVILASEDSNDDKLKATLMADINAAYELRALREAAQKGPDSA